MVVGVLFSRHVTANWTPAFAGMTGGAQINLTWYEAVMSDEKAIIFKVQRVLFKLHLIGCMRYEFFIFWPF